MAAQMAVGLRADTTACQQLNLTQLRRNRRKRPDKTSGRKRPRLGDVDVVPADNAEQTVAEQLAADIMGPEPEPEPQMSPQTAAGGSQIINTDVCHT